MARALRFSEPGTPDVLVLHDVNEVAPGPGEVWLEQESIGVNFLDITQRTGRVVSTQDAAAVLFKGITAQYLLTSTSSLLSTLVRHYDELVEHVRRRFGERGFARDVVHDVCVHLKRRRKRACARRWRCCARLPMTGSA